MIDLVYKTLLTIVNKENNGYVSPTEFNLIINTVQYEIYRSYFEDENKDKQKESRGLTDKGYSNLDYNQRHRIERFSSITNINKDISNNFPLPNDLYFIEDDGVIPLNVNTLLQDGNVIENIEKNKINYLNNSISRVTRNYPVYENYGSYIKVYPSDVSVIELRYLRTPKKPQWTYFVLPNGSESFDPSNGSYQDIELHESEFSNIVLRALTYFGINLREQEVTNYAELLKDKAESKENNI